jgi:hypothetical protein
MGTVMEALVQRIASEAMDVLGPRGRKFLLYAEVEDGVVEASLYYEKRPGALGSEFASEELADLAYELWEKWDAGSGRRFRAVEMFVNGSDFKLEVTYPESFNDDAGQGRDRAVVEKYFGNVVIEGD